MEGEELQSAIDGRNLRTSMQIWVIVLQRSIALTGLTITKVIQNRIADGLYGKISKTIDDQTYS